MTIFCSAVPLSSTTLTNWPSISPDVGIRESGARQDRVGGAVDGDVDEVDLAGILVRAAVGIPQRHLDAGDVDAVAGLLGAQKLALADRKRHIHRVLTDDDGERPALRRNDVAFRNIGLADLAGNRGSDAGIAEIDPGRLKIGFVDENSALRRLIGGERLVAGNRGTGALCQQLFRPLQLNLGEYLGGLALRSNSPSACSTAAWKSPFSIP